MCTPCSSSELGIMALPLCLLLCLGRNELKPQKMKRLINHLLSFIPLNNFFFIIIVVLFSSQTTLLNEIDFGNQTQAHVARVEVGSAAVAGENWFWRSLELSYWTASFLFLCWFSLAFFLFPLGSAFLLFYLLTVCSLQLFEETVKKGNT